MKIFKISFFLAVVLLLYGCGDLEIVEVKNDEGIVVERYQIRKSDQAKHGNYEAFNSTGQKIEEAYYQNDTLQGERTLYYDTGIAQYVEHYEDGRFEGLFHAYYPSGKLKLAGNYINGAMNGEWKGYYENGQTREVVQFENNQENGPFVEYYENGKLKVQGSYLNGDNEHGELKIIDNSGEVMKIMQCDKGICRTTWKKDTTDK